MITGQTSTEGPTRDRKTLKKRGEVVGEGGQEVNWIGGRSECAHVLLEIVKDAAAGYFEPGFVHF